MPFTLDNKTVLITGGTGTFGNNFTEYLLKKYDLKKLIIFSRDEYKQFQMQKKYNDERLRFFIGDVRDLPRLQRALAGVDIVVHAAALKQVPALEYNPFEAVKTNILGTQNVIDAAIDQAAEKVLFISTDKAAHPVNLYGATKLCAEKLIINGNSYASGKTKFSVVRYGNVIGSRGSIVEVLLKNKPEIFEITDERMTRFFITADQACELVISALENMDGGEIFIPKIPSVHMIDIFNAINPQAEKKIVGIRPGEKLHEVLITEEESAHALELKNYYVILSQFPYFSENVYKKYYENGKKLSFTQYTSLTNPQQLTTDALKKLLSEIETKL